MITGPITEAEAAAAYHEAGYAVACFLLRKAFRYVSILPEDDRTGVIMHRKMPDGFDIEAMSDVKR